MTDATDELWAKLRAPFDEKVVGKLPRVTCKKCSKAPGRVCDDHSKSECRVCGQWMTTKHMHIDYVGHAHVTDRLLRCDPLWNWEPLAWDDDGLPRFVRTPNGDPIGLWIKLTVGGVTRLGYGSEEAGKFEAEKILIGDALRNAAMRFGVAVDLWMKGEAESVDEETASAFDESGFEGLDPDQQQIISDEFEVIVGKADRAHAKHRWLQAMGLDPTKGHRPHDISTDRFQEARDTAAVIAAEVAAGTNPIPGQDAVAASGDPIPEPTPPDTSQPASAPAEPTISEPTEAQRAIDRARAAALGRKPDEPDAPTGDGSWVDEFLDWLADARVGDMRVLVSDWEIPVDAEQTKTDLMASMSVWATGCELADPPGAVPWTDKAKQAAIDELNGMDSSGLAALAKSRNLQTSSSATHDDLVEMLTADIKQRGVAL